MDNETNKETDIGANGYIEPEMAYARICEHWKSWAKEVGASKYVVGISGGVDSSVVAALACKIFGAENVIGVSLPCDGQSDMWAVDLLFQKLKIKRCTIDIGDAFNSLLTKIENNAIAPTYDCKTNMPARLRMTALFGIAQCFGAVVLNTCNLSEDFVGYATFGGDGFGCYAPIKNLTKTEVIKLGEMLGLPESLMSKTPIDGLQPLTDEEKLGFMYADLDKVICGDRTAVDAVTLTKILNLYKKNKFKTDIVRIPGPSFCHFKPGQLFY